MIARNFIALWGMMKKFFSIKIIKTFWMKILYDSKTTSANTPFIDQAKDSEKEYKQEEFQPDLFL